jgi:putative membrane protein
MPDEAPREDERGRHQPDGKEGAARLSTLKNQLDEYAKFRQGLKQYTDGVTSAGEGAATLCEGVGKLADGAKDLQEGTEELAGGADKLASGAKELNDGLIEAKDKAIEKLLPKLNDDAIAWLDRYEAIAERAQEDEHYDLVQAGEANSLSFILRSAWQ